MTDLPVIDRSTAESYARCPMSARLAETGAWCRTCEGHGRRPEDALKDKDKPCPDCRGTGKSQMSTGDAANIGNEIHAPIGRTLEWYCEAGDRGEIIGPQQVADCLRNELSDCRPDVHAAAHEAATISVWRIAKLIAGTNPANILRHDGGLLERSGQLARDLPFARVTSEVDLLLATPWPGVVREVDWKSGWRIYTETSVHDAFQFRLHACLIFENYPDIDAVRVEVFNLRTGRMTRPVEFTRNQDEQLWAEVSKAAQAWYENQAKDPKDCEAWPSREKCRICDGAAMCSVVDRDISEVATNPLAVLEYRIAATESLDSIDSLLWGHVERTGKNIVLPNGTAFGYKTPQQRKSPNPVFESNGNEDGEHDE